MYCRINSISDISRSSTQPLIQLANAEDSQTSVLRLEFKSQLLRDTYYPRKGVK